LDDPMEDAESAPDAEADRREKTARLREALEELTDRDRDVLLLWDSGQS
jgi:DNA-directed RNA polymerase specialized sigma24 family protein